MLVAKEKMLPSNRCYAVKIYYDTISKNVQSVILDTCVKFGAISADFGTNRLDCRFKFHDVLAAMLDFHFSENFKVGHHIQNKPTHHCGLCIF